RAPAFPRRGSRSGRGGGAVVRRDRRGALLELARAVLRRARAPARWNAGVLAHLHLAADGGRGRPVGDDRGVREPAQAPGGVMRRRSVAVFVLGSMTALAAPVDDGSRTAAAPVELPTTLAELERQLAEVERSHRETQEALKVASARS